ncbi:type II toxin-antitoxin system RnlA family toxin [Vibrio alginolyticus]
MAKNLGLQPDRLNDFVDEFFTEHADITLQARDITDSKQTFKLLKVGQDLATVILYVKSGGLVTITYETGKNWPLGKIFHDFLVSKCDSADTLKANLVLKGISKGDVELVLGLMRDELLDGQSAFKITTDKPTTISEKYTIACTKYKDSLTLVYHTTTYKLQIQGRALFSYRTLCYHLTELLDQQSLLAVVEKNSAEDKIVLHEEVAAQYVKKALPDAFERMDSTYRDLLTSSYCVKLASPSLPEYSMLLYPDLRVLEGVIKETMAKNDLYTSSESTDIGEYFTRGQLPQSVTLKPEYNSNFQSGTEIQCLERCYAYFKTHRHSLFHMEESGFESRTTDTIGAVMQISENIANLINSMYLSCKKL